MRQSAGSRTPELYEGLLQSIDKHFDTQAEQKSLADWAVNLPVILDGRPFTFDKHEYLDRALYSDPHPDVTHIKATQMGLSTLGMLQAIYGARYRGFKGILYLFPLAGLMFWIFPGAELARLFKIIRTRWADGSRIPIQLV